MNDSELIQLGIDLQKINIEKKHIFIPISEIEEYANQVI